MLVAPRDAGAAAPAEWRSGEIRLEIDFASDKSGQPLNEQARAHSRGFHEGLGALLAGGEKELETGREGGYLIITPPQFQTVLEPLAQWKREKGFEVRVATTAETGSDRNQIRAFIGELYRNAPVPPQFVLLVGDVNLLPAFDFNHVVTDLQYALQEGEDFLPDLNVGRFSVSDVSQAETMVAKTLRYESDPFREDPGNGAWMGRGLVVAGNYPSTTPVPTLSWARTQLLASGWSEVDSVFYPTNWIGVPLIQRSLNQGTSIVMYRGWARDIDGWEPPQFLRSHIPALNNRWMLPVVMSFVCANNRFDDPDQDCFGEVWIRAGTPTAPAGAVAFIGNGEHWSHTRFNDSAAIAAASAIREQGVRRLGELLNSIKLDFLRQFPLEIPYQSEAGESVEFYFYIYNLLGDPELALWSGAPLDVEVEVPEAVPATANHLRAV
ncbi:MAG: C25 family cysteine peptidase, partial [Candidatus Eisenbacteria bacterium]|nr:C25 family cysteine peptidase [Candidatus Eisenbacteria bacterium]